MNEINLNKMTEQDKQEAIYDQLEYFFGRVIKEYEITQASFIGVLDMYKSDCLNNWRGR